MLGFIAALCVLMSHFEHFIMCSNIDMKDIQMMNIFFFIKCNQFMVPNVKRQKYKSMIGYSITLL